MNMKMILHSEEQIIFSFDQMLAFIFAFVFEGFCFVELD